jgi:hypothetical protein
VKFIAADFIGGRFCVGVMTETKGLAAQRDDRSGKINVGHAT